MKSRCAIRKFRIFSIALIILFLSLPTWAATDDKAATVDDLFQFFLDNWANKIHLSVFEVKGMIGYILPGLTPKPNYGDVTVSFTADLINAEKTYGHLAEYWELRAHLDYQPQRDWKACQKDGMGYVVFSNRLADAELDINDLRKALELNPSDGSAQWYIGECQVDKKFPEGFDWTDTSNADKVRDYLTARIEMCEKARTTEPENGYYPMEAATFEYKLGNNEKALENLRKVGDCPYYTIPRIFPSRYAMEHIYDYESGKYSFSTMTQGAKFYLLLNFYCSDSLPNYLRIKDMYKGLIADSISRDNWRDTFNTLNRAACVMGRDEGYDNINKLVTIVLINFCLREAMNQAIKGGDQNLEKAVIAAAGKTNEIKSLKSISLSTADSPFEFSFSIIYDQFNETYNSDSGSFLSLNKLFPPKLDMAEDCRIHDKRIKRIIEDLMTFDYNNPDDWYNNWYEKMFPKVKPEESK